MRSKRQRDIAAEMEKKALLARGREEEPAKKNIFKRIIITILCVLGLVIAGIIIWWNAIRAVGKHRIMEAVENTAPSIVTEETLAVSEEERATWKEGWVKYNDKIYEYDENLITFLFMGIDKDTKVKEVAEGTNGGQADALFLMVLDQYDKKINIIGINRNTMTDINVYNEYGDFVSTTKAQIAVQHGFGNGVEESCEYQVEAVRKLFYNLPIHGYAAINMKAIPVINDTVGGVDLVALSDIHNDGHAVIIKKDSEVHLQGEDAYWYVRDRNMNEFASADVRLARQKQYLSAFVDKAKVAVKEDVSVAGQLYNDISPYMVTNVTFDEVAYLAPNVSGYSLDEEGIRMVMGETVQGEEFEEFYVDETALYDLIINVFYKEVKTN